MRVHSARLKRKTRINRIHKVLNRDIKLSWNKALLEVVPRHPLPSIKQPMTLGKRYYLIQLVAALEAEEEAYQVRINKRRPVVKG